MNSLIVVLLNENDKCNYENCEEKAIGIVFNVSTSKFSKVCHKHETALGGFSEEDTTIICPNCNCHFKEI